MSAMFTHTQVTQHLNHIRMNRGLAKWSNGNNRQSNERQARTVNETGTNCGRDCMVRPRLELISSPGQLLELVFFNVRVLHAFVHLLGQRPELCANGASCAQALCVKTQAAQQAPEWEAWPPRRRAWAWGFGYRDRDRPNTIAYSD